MFLTSISKFTFYLLTLLLLWGLVAHCVMCGLWPHLKLATAYDSPQISTDQRFRVLPNYFGHLFLQLINHGQQLVNIKI